MLATATRAGREALLALYALRAQARHPNRDLVAEATALLATRAERDPVTEPAR